jgi:hypothetical protein
VNEVRNTPEPMSTPIAAAAAEFPSSPRDGRYGLVRKKNELTLLC